MSYGMFHDPPQVHTPKPLDSTNQPQQPTQLSTRDYDARYPIHLAAAEGEVVSVEFLIYAHAEINIRDRWGCVHTFRSKLPVICSRSRP